MPVGKMTDFFSLSLLTFPTFSPSTVPQTMQGTLESGMTSHQHVNLIIGRAWFVLLWGPCGVDGCDTVIACECGEMDDGESLHHCIAITSFITSSLRHWINLLAPTVLLAVLACSRLGLISKPRARARARPNKMPAENWQVDTKTLSTMRMDPRETERMKAFWGKAG